MKKKLLLITTAMAMCLSACSSTPTNEPQSSVTNATLKELATEQASAEVPTTEVSTTESNLPEYAKVGQMVCGEKWNIALLYAKEYDSIDSDFYSDKPAEGNKFLALFFDVKNVSKDNDYFNSLYFEGYADDYSTTSSITLNTPDDFPAIGGDIDAEKMSKGVIIYEVPADWNKFEIVYKDGIWTTHKAASFVVEKADIVTHDYVFESSVYDEYVLDPSKKSEIGTEIQDDVWSVKLLETGKYDVIGDGIMATKPAEGKEFVIFFMEATNTSSADDYFNQLYFRSYVDGYLTNTSLLLSDVNGYSAMSGDVAAGKMIKGYIALEVPSDWKSIELIYDDGTFVENKVAEFAITNE